jgi:hypothetical protein
MLITIATTIANARRQRKLFSLGPVEVANRSGLFPLSARKTRIEDSYRSLANRLTSHAAAASSPVVLRSNRRFGQPGTAAKNVVEPGDTRIDFGGTSAWPE